MKESKKSRNSIQIMFTNCLEPSGVNPEYFKLRFGSCINTKESASLSGSGLDMALIGSDASIDRVREELFNLSDQLNNCKLIDFGNLKSGTSASEVESLFNELLLKNFIPVFVSSKDEHISLQLNAVSGAQPFSTWMIVNDSIFSESESQRSLIQSIKDGLIVSKFIGYQSHLTSSGSLQLLHDLQIESMRLGHIRQNIDRIEPWCRSLDHAIFQLNAIRKTDFPCKNSTNPGGLFYEEACKISQFLGASSHLQSFGIYGYEAASDQNKAGAAVIAQLIWYFIDGLMHFREDKSIQKSKLIQYTVHASHSDLDINFWKSNESGRWWMEVPGQTDHWVSCTYDDYLEASHGEFSARLINVLNRG